MELWTKLNDEVPIYLDDIIKDFNLNPIKINELKTALVGKNYALIIFIDRFYAGFYYVTRDENKNLIQYNVDSYFTIKFDDEDRQNLIEEETAKELIINNLIIINQGMRNKWSTVLEGNQDWISDFKKSKWFAVSNLREDEIQILDKLIL